MTDDTDDMEFMSGYQIRLFYGLTYGYSWLSFLSILESFSINILGALHFLFEIVLHHDKYELLSLMEISHYLMLFVSHIIIRSLTLIQSKNTKIFCELLEKEFNNSSIVLSPRQQKIKQYSDMIIARSIKWLAILLLIGIFGSFIRRPLLESDGSDLYTIPYRGWLPFRVDTLPKCFAVWAYQGFTALSVVYGHFSFIVSYSIHANHLYNQFDMLSAFIEDTFELETIKISNTEHYVRSRLKEAIKQHQLLTRCFELLQELYNFPLLAMSMTSGLMFCTTIYMLTDPGSTMSMLASVSSFSFSEFALIGLYCWYGQRVIDKWEKIKDTIYNLDWYNQTKSTKTSLLLIMTMCTRDKVIKGGGLQEFSMKGFSELLQAGFSSFNMLQALR